MTVPEQRPEGLRLRRYGEAAVLAELSDPEAVEVLRAAVRRAAVPGVLELVPAARTLLVTFAPDRTDHRRLAAELLRLRGDGAPAAGTSGSTAGTSGGAPGTVQITVVYDGPDLEDVAARCGLDVPDVVRRHSAVTYRAAFGGFAPGFAYLRGLDPGLALPRRSSPRTAVPAGSVAVAGEWTAVYPSASPGGWHLIGRTELRVWDESRTPPALLAPGTLVRFRDGG